METSSFKQEKHAEGQNDNIKTMSILYISFMVEKKSIVFDEWVFLWHKPTYTLKQLQVKSMCACLCLGDIFVVSV